MKDKITKILEKYGVFSEELAVALKHHILEMHTDLAATISEYEEDLEAQEKVILVAKEVVKLQIYRKGVGNSKEWILQQLVKELPVKKVLMTKDSINDALNRGLSLSNGMMLVKQQPNAEYNNAVFNAVFKNPEEWEIMSND